jgi:hypothetical protein
VVSSSAASAIRQHAPRVSKKDKLLCIPRDHGVLTEHKDNKTRSEDNCSFSKRQSLNEFSRRHQIARNQFINCRLQLSQRCFTYSLNDCLDLRVPRINHIVEKWGGTCG